VPTKLIYVLCDFVRTQNAVFSCKLTDWKVLRYVAEVFVNDHEMTLIVSTITHIYFVSTFHMRCSSMLRSVNIIIFSAYFFIAFLPHELAACSNIHVPFSLSPFNMSGLLLWMFLSVFTCRFHIMVSSNSLIVSISFGTLSYKCSFWILPLISLHILKCSSTVSHAQVYACLSDLFVWESVSLFKSLVLTLAYMKSLLVRCQNWGKSMCNVYLPWYIVPRGSFFLRWNWL
jgi:hypothetical protein